MINSKPRKVILAIILLIIVILIGYGIYWYWKKYYSWIPKDAKINEAAVVDIDNYYGDIITIDNNEITLEFGNFTKQTNIKVIVDANTRFFEQKEVESNEQLTLPDGRKTNSYSTYVENKNLTIKSLKAGMKINVGVRKVDINLIANEINIDK